MYLYQITNLINNKVYIGQTNNITKRWSNHKCCNSPDMVIAKAIKKYGIENFKFEVLYRNVPIEEIDELERKTILEKNCRYIIIMYDNCLYYNLERDSYGRILWIF